MKILVVGATGFIGDALARHFAQAGHTVTGTARTTEAADALKAAGITPVVGNLDDGLQSIVDAARSADATVFAALAPQIELNAVTTLLAAIEGSDKSFVFLSGSGIFMQRTEGAWSPDSFAEDDPFEVEPFASDRLKVETLVREAGARGIRGIVIRPPVVWGPGDHNQVLFTYQSVGITGSACYVGEGLATYSNVHVEDVCALFTLALDKGETGGLYHAVGGEIPNRWIAEAVARDLGCDTKSVTMAEASEIWGEFGALIMASTSRSRAPRSIEELGWKATHTDMLSTIGEPRFRALAMRQTAEA